MKSFLPDSEILYLIAINSSEKIDSKKYRKCALETAHLYVDKYDFYQMSPTMHKMLIHGGDIMDYAILPLGYHTIHCFYVAVV